MALRYEKNSELVKVAIHGRRLHPDLPAMLFLLVGQRSAVALRGIL